LKGEALNRTLWETGFVKGYGLVVRQNIVNVSHMRVTGK